MSAKAKRITLYLDDGTLDGLINFSESDGWDLGGELYSCPLDKVPDLLSDDTISNKIGVYLLLSSKRIYIGQAVDLKSRTSQHLIDKDWWERIVLLTSNNNGLNQSYITYLESQLISKATECGVYEVDNKTKGNKVMLSKFDKQLLDQYLEEAYFALELIGVNAFKKDSKQSEIKTILPPIVDATKEQRELRAKREIKTFLENKGIKLPKFFSYAKLQEKKRLFWINPDVRLLKEEWTLVLNNQVDKKIYILKVPANTFVSGAKYGGNTLKVRPDKPIYIDLNIHCEKFIDVGSKLSFKEFVDKEIKY